MLSQTSAEALHSAAYVQHYLDCVENLPDDLQRYLTRMRELDVSYRACLRDLEKYASTCRSTDEANATKRTRALARVHSSLITAQEIGDEKLHLVTAVQDLIDTKSRQLDHDYRTLLSSMEVTTNGAGSEEAATPTDAPPVRDKEPPPAPPVPPPVRNASPPAPPQHEREKEKNDRDKTGERWSKRARRSRTTTSNNAGAHTDGDSGERENNDRSAHNYNTHKKGIGKKKKRKARASAARAETPPEEADTIDPDEPRYCLCDQISFGEMILCDNDLCPIEWFHFSCVSLTTKPKGKWFCPKCRGDRPNVMKPKGQFLKELERYNKEKEEKA